MQKCSQNSRSLRNSVGFSELGLLELAPARPPFLHLLAALVEAMPFFAAILEQWAELDLHGTMPKVRKQLPDPTAKR